MAPFLLEKNMNKLALGTYKWVPFLCLLISNLTPLIPIFLTLPIPELIPISVTFKIKIRINIINVRTFIFR